MWLVVVSFKLASLVVAMITSSAEASQKEGRAANSHVRLAVMAQADEVADEVKHTAEIASTRASSRPEIESREGRPDQVRVEDERRTARLRDVEALMLGLSSVCRSWSWESKIGIDVAAYARLQRRAGRAPACASRASQSCQREVKLSREGAAGAAVFFSSALHSPTSTSGLFSVRHDEEDIGKQQQEPQVIPARRRGLLVGQTLFCGTRPHRDEFLRMIPVGP